MVKLFLAFVVISTASSNAIVKHLAADQGMLNCSSLSPAILIAQQYQGWDGKGVDPHGKDPHGGDPHWEQHDDDLPANKDRDAYKVPKNVYGDDVENKQKPY
jgi:hypothetical protein